ncbi:MAG TPA: hypothetical protein VG520_09540 [Candidatus Dormibacteraeota bacterium]|nr:hypothetical protein [Candidatus Dormibacteraeota bacterium]
MLAALRLASLEFCENEAVELGEGFGQADAPQFGAYVRRTYPLDAQG